MPPKPIQENVSVPPRTHGVEPRCIQTSGIFRVPAEVILGILANFGDPRHEILLASRIPRMLEYAGLHPKLVEWSTVTRRLTMTCWHLRNMLFPLLWKYMEGRNFSPLSPPCRFDYFAPIMKNGLYAQCAYLLLNPTVGLYVQTVAVDLHIQQSTWDTMEKFVECLIQLPNLRTLEVFSAGDPYSITRELERKSARFPGVRELGISDGTAQFAGSCPNVETITALFEFSSKDARVLGFYGGRLKKLKRVVGIPEDCVRLVVKGCPYLQEIGIKGMIEFIRKPISVANAKVAEHLRSLRRLAVVELDYAIQVYSEDEVKCRVRVDKQEALLKEWTGLLIPVLKDSPSKERKFLRWMLSEIYPYPRRPTISTKSRELQVLPETPLHVRE